MIELVGYPEGNIIRVTKPQFDKLNEMGYLNYDDEPNYDLDPEEFEATGGGGQWRFDNEDEEKIRKILIKGVGEMKLTREDIRKYGTEEEREFLKEFFGFKKKEKTPKTTPPPSEAVRRLELYSKIDPGFYSFKDLWGEETTAWGESVLDAFKNAGFAEKIITNPMELEEYMSWEGDRWVFKIKKLLNAKKQPTETYDSDSYDEERPYEDKNMSWLKYY